MRLAPILNLVAFLFFLPQSFYTALFHLPTFSVYVLSTLECMYLTCCLLYRGSRAYFIFLETNVVGVQQIGLLTVCVYLCILNISTHTRPCICKGEMHLSFEILWANKLGLLELTSIFR